ncbi:SET family protein [Megaselia abdita]
MNQGPVKKAKVSEEDETTILRKIDGIQTEIDHINEDASEEILLIEEKYNGLRKPCYDRRGELIKNVKSFWVTAMVNHPNISSILDENEECECLHSLWKLEVEEFSNIKSGYKISFHFSPNKYFENEVLTKEFHLGKEEGPHSKSTPIKWKEGHNLLKQLLSRPSNTRKRRNLEFKTFFDWFTDNSDPINDEIAELIRDDLYPNPLQYYLVPDVEIEGDGQEEPSGDEEAEDDEEDDI